MLSSEIAGSVQEKVNEYGMLAAPVEQAIRELQFARGMLRARAEDEINNLSPALAALSDALGISTLDLRKIVARFCRKPWLVHRFR
jgi:hypothetical protein